MSGVFNVGEQKTRPGIYSRIVKSGGEAPGVSKQGIAAGVIQATWGPLNVPITITGLTQAARIFGVGGTTALIGLLLKHCKTLRIVRAGTGGAAASVTLVDDNSTPNNVVTITAKYKGTRPLSITVQDDLLDATKRVAIIREGTVELERVKFGKGEDEVNGIIAALAESEWVVPSLVAAGTGTLANVTNAALTGGSDPTVSATEYGTALEALESVTWSVLALDTDTTTIHAVADEYIKRLFSEGKRAQLVLGETSSVAFATRLSHAAAFNSKLIVYVVGGGYNAVNAVEEGWKAAAIVAGLIAGTPNNKSVTHVPITNWSQVSEVFSSTQIEQALQSGVVIITADENGQPRVEQGITTLVTPSADEDEGWKKIRRTRARFELLDRIDAVGDSLLGRINNDAAGRGEFAMKARNVISAMISEQKLNVGTEIALDSANPPTGDSAWWTIAVSDPDSVEKIYITYETNLPSVV